MSNQYITIPGALVSGGASSLVDLANRYPNNPEIANLVTGSLADVYRTQANTGLSLQYNDAYQSSLLKMQGALNDLQEGTTGRLMSQEGAITERLQQQSITGQQGIEQIKAGAQRYGYDKVYAGKELETAAQRYGYDVTSARELEGSKYAADTQYKTSDITSARQLEGTRYSVDADAGARRFASEAQLKGVDISSGRELEGSKYAADTQFKTADVTSARQLEGTRYGYDSQERQIGLTGEQERKNIAEKYQREKESQIGLRADARGAIRSQGARFYG